MAPAGVLPEMTIVKAHALGNDFLLLEAASLPATAAGPALARALCSRHRGIGADGLIVFEPSARGASMRLLNADGSPSEISGNGVRCLAAWIASRRRSAVGTVVEIVTDAGAKVLELLEQGNGVYVFRAAMGSPEEVRRVSLSVGGQTEEVITMRVGNPQCVSLGDVSEARLHTTASALAVHPHFPQGTNVELAQVEAADRVRILIWERGVGPTEASGTGACAAAVAAMRFGGAARDVEVVSPGGAQRVEWAGDGLYLTGPAEIIAQVDWLKGVDA
jgi:diaminopimelate epimerase